MSAGEFVYENINAIIKYCDTVDGDELELLLDAGYSKKTFNINFPFFIDAADIDETNTKKQSRRFRKDVYTVRGRRVRVTSQWLYTHLPCFYGYLERKNIRPVVPMPEGIKKTNGGKTKSKPAAKVNNRNAIGNAANLLVRNILSNLGDETFDENDWLETQKFFNGRCAYCGSGGELEKDHAVPINKEKLGEHKIGNIVPSCKKCNSAKAGKDYREFLENNIDAVRNIEAYMDSRNYVPLKNLENNAQLRKILNMAYDEVSIVADRYIAIINELFIHT